VTKKNILIVVLTAVVFHVSWYAISRMLMNKKLPDEATVPIMLIHAEKDSISPQAYVENIFNRLTGKKKYLFLKNTQHLVMTNNVDEVVPPITAWLKRSHVNSPYVDIFKNIRSGVSLNKLIS
jgi:pimeloyl-ACP methyl ester carboxylesterase